MRTLGHRQEAFKNTGPAPAEEEDGVRKHKQRDVHRSHSADVRRQKPSGPGDKCMH